MQILCSLTELSKYDLPISGLKEGEHKFNYWIEDVFFEDFENSPIQKGKFDVVLLLAKKFNYLELSFDIKGDIDSICDRCAETFTLKFNELQSVFIKFKDDFNKVNSDPDVIYISSTLTHYNIAHLIYEYIILSIPMRQTHPIDENGETCSFDQYLDEEEDEIVPIQTEIDPRWEALKKLNQ